MILDQSAEILRLRALLRDLLALAAVGDAWVGRDPTAIAAELSDVLIESLQLDFAFVHLCDSRGCHAVEATRGDSWPSFPGWLQQRIIEFGQITQKEILTNVNEMKNSHRGFIIPVGADGERGLVAAACDRSDFPNETDQLLISMAANNAATAFHNACLINELRTAEEALRNSERELRSAQERLEIKVEERTAELHHSEAFLAEAQRLSHTGSFGWNPDTGVIAWSDETYRIFEYDRTLRPTIASVVQRVHPDDRTLAQQVIDRASQTGTGFEHEYRLLLADGRVKHVHAIAHASQGASGNRELIGAVTDITERKTAEEKIRCNEAELRTLIDITPAIVATTLPDGSVDFVSQSGLDYSGLSKEEAMGWGWTGTIHRDDVDRALANIQTGLASGEPFETEFRCRRADGVYHWFLNRSLPLRDDEGRIAKWYGILFDVNALKETESALQSREHELLGIIETIPSMLWSASPAGETTHLSQRFLEYCGAPLEELVNHGWERSIHPDDLEETAKAFNRAITSGESYSTIHRVRRADGEYRWHHSMGEPLRDPDGKIIQWYGLATDIDERKRAEDHLRDTRIKLAKASRLATVAELAGSIAHELNQPLMSILANGQAAKKWLNAASPNMPEANSSIERVIRDARAADETMQHIRALFKQKSFDKKDVNIPDILHEVVRVIQEDPKKRDVPIQFRFEQHLPVIHVDQIQIQQVFINLIVNAIEALEGQQVAPQIVLRAATNSSGMLIEVIDNGPGVHDLNQIFDAFMTTKENGMGIGLAVSRSIVEAHGGRLWAENNKTGGATLSVALPHSPTGAHGDSNPGVCLS